MLERILKRKCEEFWKSARCGNNSRIFNSVTPANNAGRSLGNAVSQGAGSVDMSPVGSNMARGVASGIRASQGEAVAAMQNLVAAVNAEAQKKQKLNHHHAY